MVLYDCVDRKPLGVNTSEYYYQRGEPEEYCDSGDFCSESMEKAPIFKHMDIYQEKLNRRYLILCISILFVGLIVWFVRNKRINAKKRKLLEYKEEEQIALNDQCQIEKEAEDKSIDLSGSGAEISIDFTDDSLPFLSGIILRTPPPSTNFFKKSKISKQPYFGFLVCLEGQFIIKTCLKHFWTNKNPKF